MRLVRKIMQDRSSAGAIAVLALLLFLLQGLANGVSSGIVAAMALVPDNVICSSHMPDGSTEKNNPVGKLGNECCGTLCGIASASSAALLVSPTQIAGLVTPRLAITLWHPTTTTPTTPPNKSSHARAPPHFPHA